MNCKSFDHSRSATANRCSVLTVAKAAEKERKTMYTTKLKSMPYANCKVLIEPHEFGIAVTLRSYETDVLALEFVNGELRNAWFGAVNYSTTTARHVNKFSTEWLGWNAYHYAKEHRGLDWLDDIDSATLEQTKRTANRTLSAYLREVV